MRESSFNRRQYTLNQLRPYQRVRFRLTEELTQGGSAAAVLVTAFDGGTLTETAEEITVYDADGAYSGSIDDYGKAEWWADAKRLEIYDLHCCHPYATCGLAEDNFNRSDDTDLGTDWTEVAGDAEILSNKLHIATANTLVTHDTVNPDTPKAAYVGVGVTGDAGDTPRVIVNYTDADNYHFVQLEISATLSCLTLNARVAGVNSVLAYRYVEVDSFSNPLQVWFGGGYFMAGFRDPPDIQDPLRVEATGTGNKVGLGSGATAANIDFEDFRWERMASATLTECRMMSDPCFLLGPSDGYWPATGTDLGCTWVETAGSWTTEDFDLVTSSASAPVLSRLNWSNPALWIETEITIDADGDSVRVILDYQDSNNYVCCELESSDGVTWDGISGNSVSWIRVISRVAAVETTVYETWYSFAPTFPMNETIRVCLNADGLMQVTGRIGTVDEFSFAVQLDPPIYDIFGFATGSGNTGQVKIEPIVQQVTDECEECIGEPCDSCHPDEALPAEIEVEMTGWAAGDSIGGADAASLNAAFTLQGWQTAYPLASCDWGIDPRSLLLSNSVFYKTEDFVTTETPILTGLTCLCPTAPATSHFDVYLYAVIIDMGNSMMRIRAWVTVVPTDGSCYGGQFVWSAVVEACDWDEVELMSEIDWDGLVDHCEDLGVQITLIDFSAVTVTVRRV